MTSSFRSSKTTITMLNVCMQTLFRYLILSVFFFLALPPSAQAEDQKTYVVFKAGIFMPKDYQGASASTGPAGELAAGYFFTPFFAMEGGIGYFRTDMTFLGINGKFRNEVMPVTVSIKGVERGENFVGSIGIGAGIYYENLKTAEGPVLIDDRDSVSGWHISLGYDFRLGDRSYLGFEYKILFIDKAEFENAGFKVGFNMSGSTLFGTFGWRF